MCKSREMVARVKTSKIFDGKIYAKTKPNLCVNDIHNSLDFEIRMKYHDVDCDVKEVVQGHFSNDIVIQHHDMIVTTKDLGLSIHCKYDLSNRSITNNVNLAVDGLVVFIILLPFPQPNNRIWLVIQGSNLRPISQTVPTIVNICLINHSVLIAVIDCFNQLEVSSSFFHFLSPHQPPLNAINYLVLKLFDLLFDPNVWVNDHFIIWIVCLKYSSPIIFHQIKERKRKIPILPSITSFT